MGYKVCPYCGAYLDPDEKCDCREKIATSQQENESVRSNQTDTEK